MQAEKEEAMKEAKVSIWRLLRAEQYRQQLFVALTLHLSQQFSGINAVRNNPARFYLLSDIICSLKASWATLSRFDISEPKESSEVKERTESVK